MTGAKIAMFRDHATPRFLYQSLQLFGGVRDGLLKPATHLATYHNGRAQPFRQLYS